MGSRVIGLDVIRGSAFVLMAVFHFGYDLSMFNFIEFSFQNPFWKVFRAIIVFLFCFAAGIGVRWQLDAGMNWPVFFKRTGLIGIAALVISIATKIVAPSSWIYFGILHFMFVSLIIAAFIGKSRWLSFGLALIIWYLWWQYNLRFDGVYDFFAPILGLPKSTWDITHFVPWFASVCFGLFIGSFGKQWLKWPNVKWFKPLIFAGQHSLVFYLVHQIPLFLIALLLHFGLNCSFSPSACGW